MRRGAQATPQHEPHKLHELRTEPLRNNKAWAWCSLSAPAAQQQRRHVRRLGRVGRVRGRVMVQPVEARRHLRGRCL